MRSGLRRSSSFYMTLNGAPISTVDFECLQKPNMFRTSPSALSVTFAID